MKNPANVTRRRKKAQQALAPGFGTGAITHQAPGKYTGKGLKGAAEGATVDEKPMHQRSSGDLLNAHYDLHRAASGTVVKGDKPKKPKAPSSFPAAPGAPNGNKDWLGDPPEAIKSRLHPSNYPRPDQVTPPAGKGLHRAANGVMVAKGKAKAEGSGPNQAQPKRTLERSRDSAGNDMARGGNDEIAYGKAKAAGK